MFAAVQHNLVLWLGAKTGLTVGVLIFLAVAFLAAAMAFSFLCVTACGWASAKLGAVFGSLATAGAFLLVVILAAAIGLLVRRQTQRRAVLERAARTQGPFHPGMLQCCGPDLRMAARYAIGLGRFARRAAGSGSAAPRGHR